jgi:hypothetical protein
VKRPWVKWITDKRTPPYPVCDRGLSDAVIEQEYAAFWEQRESVIYRKGRR